jgi:alpha-galactosidase
MFTDVADLRIDRARTSLYVEGWQSWSPTGLFAVTAAPPKPSSTVQHTMGFRPGKDQPPDGFQAEGLLAVSTPNEPVHVFAAREPTSAVPSIRARVERDRLIVSADGVVLESTFDDDLPCALATWAESLGARQACRIPPGWCSWYCYWQEVREEDVVANLEAIERHELPVEIVQIDDGYQSTVGDWLAVSPRFGSVESLAEKIRQTGRTPGIWIAPFLVGADSALAAEHPDWLVADADAGYNWNQRLRVLDVADPDARAHLSHVFATLVSYGFAYFKLDFLYAGAIPGIDAYRDGLRIIRQAVGEDALLLGCGAPIFPSVGLVDALRIGPDIATNNDAVASAIASGRARAWMNKRFWVNDPDCLIVRPEVEEREGWADHVEACDGVVFSSDAIDELDERGLELTRRVLAP